MKFYVHVEKSSRLIVEKNTHAPLAPCVNDPVAKNQTTRAADHVPTAKVLYEIRRVLPAIVANETDREVRSEHGMAIVLNELSEREWFGV